MPSRPSLDESLWDWSRRSLERWRGRPRMLRCTRCRKPAAGLCAACSAPTCPACSVISSESGATVALCRTCAPMNERPEPPMDAIRRDPSRPFLRGARILAVAIGLLALWSLVQVGPAGPLRVLRVLIHPAVLFAIVPFAWLVGVLTGGLRR